MNLLPRKIQQVVLELRLGALFCTLKMEDNDGAGTMIKLDSTNYSIWKSRVEDLSFCKDLYDPIERKMVLNQQINLMEIERK